MSRGPLTASLESVRRLAVAKQHLAGKLPARATAKAMLSVVRDLAYVQWDPVTVVAPSHLISFWCRVGDFQPSELDRLLWEEKTLFLHWTPIASIVLTEDYPLYYSLMRRYPESLSRSWANHRTRAKKFLAEHSELRRKMLNELRKGPRQLSQFEDHTRTRRNEGEWSFGSDVSLMLFHLLMSGTVMVVGHQGNQNLWGLSERFLPDWVEKKELPDEDVDRAAAQRAIRALGTATPTEINYHFVRGRYHNLRATLARLLKESTIHRVHVEGFGNRDERYIHDQDVPLLESMGTAAWQPRMSLLPPFDNLIYSQARTKRLFGFDYVREQFLPKEKRRFGTHVLPILWGDQLIGRIDPRLDKGRAELVINAVHAEPDAPGDREVAAKIGETIARFAAFLGASQVTYTSRVPGAWKSSLC
ncbi:MAG: winged helix DNA-binding domain-containing protein [Thermoplasmata archaeon]|nr:winged helix DNA-binding domain-containing protein [Thermoplasmata archaeon]